jgi:hypothetical protein
MNSLNPPSALSKRGYDPLVRLQPHPVYFQIVGLGVLLDRW